MTFALLFQSLIIRVPIHEIAAVCYVNDDGDHILAIKYGNVSIEWSKDDIHALLY